MKNSLQLYCPSETSPVKNSLQLYCPSETSPMENSSCSPREKQAATESCYTLPTYGTCWVFECFHNPPNSYTDYRICNVPTYANSFDYTRGCTDTVRESALKVDSARKIPCRTGESNLRRGRAGPMLYQLSYIPIQPVREVCSLCCK